MASRRGNNTGTITKRADGRWMARVSLGFVDGKDQRKTFYGRTREEAEGKMLNALRERRRGMPVRSSTPTFKAFILEWLDSREGEVAPRTSVSYRQIITRHVMPVLGQVKLEAIEKRHLVQLYRACNRNGLSPSSIHTVRNIVRAALNEAVDQELIGRNVATSKTGLPKVERFEGRSLSAVEVNRMLTVSNDSRHGLAHRIAVQLGMRQAEILGLSWKDIDYDAGVIRVRKQLQRIDGVLILRDLKTEKSRRDLPVPESMMPLLKLHRTRQVEERLMAGGKWNGSWDLVFLTTIGTPVESSTLRKDFLKVLAEAGIEQVRFHDLRHTFASLMAASGVHLTAAQAMLGHSNVNTTAQIYTHVQSESMRSAVAAVDTVLERENKSRQG